MLTIGSLFSGIGGLELGLEWAGLGPVLWQVEKEEFCRGILARHWPDATRFDDVRAVGAANLASVDVICGGFPCQDISTAGAGAGIEGERSGLWFEFARIIGELRPRFVVVENVAALVGRGLDRVLGELAARGYDAIWFPLRAADVGAPHRRERLFIVGWLADPDTQRQRGLPSGAREEHARVGVGGCNGAMADARRRGVQPDADARGIRGAPPAAESEGHQRERGGDAAGGGGAMADATHSPLDGRERIGEGREVAGLGSEAMADAARGVRQREASRRTGHAALGDEGVADASEGGRRARKPLVSGEPQPDTARGGAGNVADTGSDGPRRLALSPPGHHVNGHHARREEATGRVELGGEGGEPGQLESVMGRVADGLPRWLDRWPAGPGEAQHAWEAPRVAVGIPNRPARLRALGNAVVPQVAYVVGRVVMQLAGGDDPAT